MATPNNDRLIRALRAARDAKLTGALRIEGHDVAGTLFFEGGQLYFGVLDGHGPTAATFESEGISRETLQAASSAPRSNDRFADALMSVGAPGAAVRAFAHRALTTAIAGFALIEDAKISASDRRHPYGPGFMFDVDGLMEDVGAIPSKTKNASIEPTVVVSATASDEVAAAGLFRRRTGLRPAAVATDSE